MRIQTYKIVTASKMFDDPGWRPCCKTMVVAGRFLFFCRLRVVSGSKLASTMQNPGTDEWADKHAKALQNLKRQSAAPATKPQSKVAPKTKPSKILVATSADFARALSSGSKGR